jgi:WD40 repeat protein
MFTHCLDGKTVLWIDECAELDFQESTPHITPTPTPSSTITPTPSLTSTPTLTQTATPTGSMTPITLDDQCYAIDKIPEFTHIAPGNVHDVKLIDEARLGEILAVALSDDREILVAANKNGFCFYNLSDNDNPVFRSIPDKNRRIIKAAFSPDEKYFAVAFYDHTVSLYEIGSWKSGELLLIDTLEGHTATINSIAFSNPYGRYLITLDNNYIMIVWEHTANGFERVDRCRLQAEEEITAIEFNPYNAGVFAYASMKGFVVIYNITDCRIENTLRSGGGRVYDLAFSSSGYLAAGDEKNAWLWDIEMQGHNPDGMWFAHSTDVYSVNFDPDGYLLAAGDAAGRIKIWQTGFTVYNMPIYELTHDANYAHNGRVYGVGFSPDGTLIVSGSSDGYIRVWGIPSP